MFNINPLLLLLLDLNHPWQEDLHLLAFLAHVVKAKVGDELPAPRMRRFFEQITSHIDGKVVQ